MVLQYFTQLMTATDMKKYGTTFRLNQKTYGDANKMPASFDNFLLTKEIKEDTSICKVVEKYRAEMEIENEKVRVFCEEAVTRMKDIQDKYNPTFTRMRVQYNEYLKKLKAATKNKDILYGFKYEEIECEICFEIFHEESINKVACCKKKICDLCISKINRCPFCRATL